MFRRVCAVLIGLALLASSVTLTSPAQAKRLSKGVYFNSNGSCYVGDQWCGGDLWVIIPKRYLPNPEQRSSFKWSLKTKSGKKARATLVDANDYSGYSQVGDYVGNAVFYKEGKDQGPNWWLPTGFRKGTYKLTFTIKARGVWDCSMEYYEVCKWIKPFTYHRTVSVKLRNLTPDEWLANE